MCKPKERMNEPQESEGSGGSFLRTLAIGVLAVIGIVLYALIAACVGAHKREGR